MEWDVVVRSRNIVTTGGVVDGWIGISDGKIRGLGVGDPAIGGASKVVDAEDNVVLPGLIDTHVHIRFPGHPEREDFLTGTRAAAAGGVTTVLEMPISMPPSWNAELLQARMNMARGQLIVDMGFYAAGGTAAIPHIASLAEAGAVGYKIFMHRPQTGREAEFEGLWATSTGDLYRLMTEISDTKLKACVHAEDDELVTDFQNQLVKSGRVDPIAHAEAHPVLAEVLAIDRAVTIAAQTGTRLQICHVSSGSGADRIRMAKMQGICITGETCPHYLVRVEDDMRTYGPYAKINPPLRNVNEQAGLWQAVVDGTIDYIGSDHAPYSTEEKERGAAIIWDAPSGCPGLETTLPLLLSAVDTRRLSWVQLADLVSTRASREFGLKDKGAIALGKDADLVAVNMTPGVIRREEMYTKVPDTARIYDGQPVVGRVDWTMVRGTQVYNRGRFLVSGDHGRVVRPSR